MEKWLVAGPARGGVGGVARIRFSQNGRSAKTGLGPKRPRSSPPRSTRVSRKSAQRVDPGATVGRATKMWLTSLRAQTSGRIRKSWCLGDSKKWLKSHVRRFLFGDGVCLHYHHLMQASLFPSLSSEESQSTGYSLVSFETGMFVRPATVDEVIRATAQARLDGGYGLIAVRGHMGGPVFIQRDCGAGHLAGR